MHPGHPRGQGDHLRPDRSHGRLPRGARQVARILHSCSQQEGLPWHRVVNREGRISLEPFQEGKEQRQRLEQEGVEFDLTGRIDLKQFLRQPDYM